MFICRVVGSVVSNAKHPCYRKYPLLIVRPTDTDGNLKEKGTMVAVDAIGAGVGDWVLVVSGGGASFDILDIECGVPLREVVVGVIDRIRMKGKDANG